MRKLLEVLEKCKWETRTDELKIEPWNILLRILWICYNCHSIILLKNCTRLYHWSNLYGYRLYYGWQYFTGKYSLGFNPGRNIYFHYRGISWILFYLMTLMIMCIYAFIMFWENIMCYSLSCNILNLCFKMALNFNWF